MSRIVRTSLAVLATLAAVCAAVLVGSSSSQAAPPTNTDVGQATCVTDASGFCTIPHNLGVRPLHVDVTSIAPVVGAANMCTQGTVSSYTTISFRVRCFNPGGGFLANREVTLSFEANAVVETPPVR